MSELPLEGVRVVELGHALAGPFAATLLGDFGADIIKIERVDGGDSLRAMGPKHDGTGVWWSVTGRNKRSIGLNYKDPAGYQVLMDLLAGADVMVENFRPGALERAGLGWDTLKEKFPQLIMLRISGFGQTGPHSPRPGFGKIAEAFSGATFLTGHADLPPVHPGYSLGDATTGLMGAFGVLLAMESRRRTGAGQLIDLALYEPLFRMIEWQLPLYGLNQELATRNGTQFPFDGAFVTDICATADGESVVVSAATTASLNHLRAFVNGQELAELDAPDSEIVNGLRTWVSQHSRDEALERLEAEGLVVGAVFSAADLIDDPHLAARESIVYAQNGAGGDAIPMPAALPKLSATPGVVRWSGPPPGAHTVEILTGTLGYSEAQVRDLLSAGVVGAAGEPSGAEHAVDA